MISPLEVRKTAVFVMKTAVFGCGGRTRTYDLRVMSPTSFQLLYSAIFTCTLECLDSIAHRRPFVNSYFLLFSVETQGKRGFP